MDVVCPTVWHQGTHGSVLGNGWVKRLTMLLGIRWESPKSNSGLLIAEDDDDS